ncbi:hypothetical protein [Streptomyces niveus]
MQPQGGRHRLGRRDYASAAMLYGVLAAAGLAAVSLTVGARVFRRADA